METKIALIIDKSLSYLDFQKGRLLSEWGVKLENTKIVNSLSQVGTQTIFEESLTSIIFVEQLEQLKKLLKEIEQSVKNNTFNDKVENGLIIMTTVPRVSTKKLEKIIIDFDGEVIYAKENSKDKNVVDKILSDLFISRSVKDFIKDYISDDYDNVISLVRSLSNLSDKQQGRVTVEDIYVRMPKAPGSIPPWEIEKSLFNKNVNEMVKTFRRINYHSHYLVTLSIVKNKVYQAYKISSLLMCYPGLSDKEISSSLNMTNNYPLKLAIGNAKKWGYLKTQRILEIILDVENKVKGGSSSDPVTEIELAFIKIIDEL